MKPHLRTLHCAGRLRTLTALPSARQTLHGARSYVQTAGSARTPLISSQATAARFSHISEQRRCITHKHLQKVKEGKEQWAEWAQEIKAGKRKSFVQHLEERGLIHDVVGDRDLLDRLFTEKRAGIYVGVDPTAPSLHVGHMLPFIILAWGYVWGLPVTYLLGGATSKVGDPTGRLKGREQMNSSVRKANMANMHMQLKKLGVSAEQYGIEHGYQKERHWKRALANNSIWWNGTAFVEVIRDLGNHVRLGPMLGRETVKNRLAKGDGMSFAEFSYPLMQAWDWWVLFRKGVQVQVGGSDQYGNILFGMDAVKMISKNTPIEECQNPLEDDLDKPIGFTTPLLTAPNGEKFGKSAGNAVWLDKDMTSTFELYQFFVRTPDEVVESYLKMFTFLPIPKIAEIMAEQNQDPSKRIAQHALAYEFLWLVHGKQEANAVAMQHRQLFRSRTSTAEPTPLPKVSSPPSSHANSSTAGFANPQSGNKYAPQTNFANMGSPHVTLPRSLVFNQPFHKILWHAGLVASKGEGHRIVANKGAYVGSRPGDSGPMSDDLAFTPIETWRPEKTEQYIIDGELLLLKLGKWKFRMVKIISDEEFKERGLSAPGWESEKSEPETESDAQKISDEKSG